MNIRIRPLRIDDAAVSYRWRNDPDVWKYTANRPDTFISSEIEHQWIIQAINEESSRRFAILVDDIYVGNTQLTNLDMSAHCGRFHIFIGERDYWGKGVATQATRQILAFATNELSLKKVFLKVHPDNISALQIYRKLGFVELSDEIGMMIDLNTG